jgi:hypothetical protein
VAVFHEEKVNYNNPMKRLIIYSATVISSLLALMLLVAICVGVVAGNIAGRQRYAAPSSAC